MDVSAEEGAATEHSDAHRRKQRSWAGSVDDYR
jgi:hypothetical protein